MTPCTHDCRDADCTGLATGGVKWLKTAGFATDLTRISYKPKVQYSTMDFCITPELGAKLPIPGGRRQVSLHLVPDFKIDNKVMVMVRRENSTGPSRPLG